MRIMYVASNPKNRHSLNLEREINELQQRFDWTSVEPITLSFHPALRVEELPGELSKRRPEILHLAAHGDSEALALSDEDGEPIKVTAEMLRGFFPPNHVPRLVYLNSCDSVRIAKRLVESGTVSLAIGSTAPITNRVARASAVAFYERLLAGLTIEQSFEACKQMAEAMAGAAASVKLYKSREVSPETDVMHPVPRLIADFMDGKLKPNSDGHYSFRLGLIGCPTGTTQVIFFTDDESYIRDYEDLESDLTWVVRDTPVNGLIWTDEDIVWRAEGDHRLVAAGLKSGGGCYIVESTLCEAIENRYRLSELRGIPRAVAGAIKKLRANNGAELSPTVWDANLAQRKRKGRT
jgi:hypothetical protein